MQFEIDGKVKLIHDKQTFGSGFEKREFVVVTQEKYPQEVKFELTGDRIDIISSYGVGDMIKVKFNIRGNEYNGRHFVNLRAWAVDPLGQNSGGSPQDGNEFQGQGSTPPPAEKMPESDDLPF